MFNFDKKYLYIALAIFVLSGIISFTRKDLIGLLFILPGVIIAITFHEFAHAFAADKLGDDTPRMQNRLNLNPMSHLDPIGTVLLIFAKFGWGKPVQINPRNFNRKFSMQTSEAIVSLAGPLMNFILAIIFALGLGGIIRFADTSFIISQTGSIIVTIIQYALIVNIGLGVFNLIPLPPLDGSKIFVNFMPYSAREFIYKYEQIFYFVFLGLWISGLASIIISPIIDVIYNGIVNLVLLLFRIG